MLYYITGGALLLLALAALIFKLQNQGRREEQNDQMKQVLDDIYAANAARDRIDRDAADARRVRERFTR
jgi:hypothetical protein